MELWEKIIVDIQIFVYQRTVGKISLENMLVFLS